MPLKFIQFPNQQLRADQDAYRIERLPSLADLERLRLKNLQPPRPIFSPTEYVQIKGRGTRRFTFKIGHTEYEKKNFFLLDFCAVAGFEEREQVFEALRQSTLIRQWAA